MPLDLQPKILRIIEEGEVTRIGSNKPIKLSARIISATNKDIKEMVKKGDYRKDLYYRLNTFQVDLSPLRERKEDIVLLANRFMQQFCMENGFNVFLIPEKVNKILKNYDWEGNVRELKNVIQRAVFLAKEFGQDKANELTNKLYQKAMEHYSKKSKLVAETSYPVIKDV